MDRAPGFGPGGWGFESSRARKIQNLKVLELKLKQKFFKFFSKEYCEKKTKSYKKGI